MGFGQGLSGLNAAAQDLDVIGNNIANSGTVGFKSGTATFADVYANSRVGLGTQVSGINQNFVVGNVKGTGNQFDMAIDGANGMFRVQDTSGNVLYTRNGQFHADKDNYIVNMQGQRLTGYDVSGTNLVPIKVPVGNIAPKATANVDYTTNLDASVDVIDQTANPFDPTDATTYSHQQAMTVYDSLGNSHQFTQYFVKRAGTPVPPATSTQSNWDTYYYLDGEMSTTPAPTGTAPTLVPTSIPMTFDTNGTLTSAATAGVDFANPGSTSSPADAMDMTLNYAGSTQFDGKDFSANFTQYGYPTGEYASMSVAPDGSIVASYTNGQTQSLGTLVLANFNNLQGLKPVGGNAWAETSESGQPILGQPGSNGLSQIKGQAVEQSNVDLSQELVNMIIAQRTYQANAQTIKTQDQIMQTLITMR